MRASTRYRIYGIAFLALMVAAVAFVYAVFTQKFTSFDHVTLDADNIGLQLPDKADVKVRGEIVGQVTQTALVNGGGTHITLGIDPSKIGTIPDNVTASLIPKTLFGEKYVSLQIPKSPSSNALKAGDTISQTKLPVEVEQVLNDIYPLLRAVQPAELNYTLTALADALEGRGNAIGKNLTTLGSYLRRLNPQLPQLIGDLRKLSSVANTYADVTPELAATLRNSLVTGNTLRGRETVLRQFLRDTTAFSVTAKGFLDDNGDNIITLGRVSEPTAALLRTYSPEFPCMLKGIVKQADKLATTFRGYVFHINADVIPKQPRAYNAGDKPIFGAKNPPHCGTLPNPPYSPSNPYRNIPDFNDGVRGQLSKPGGDPENPRTATGYRTSVAPTVIGSADEKGIIDALVAQRLGVPADQVPDVATLLFSPIARGSVVSN